MCHGQVVRVSYSQVVGVGITLPPRQRHTRRSAAQLVKKGTSEDSLRSVKGNLPIPRLQFLLKEQQIT
jgi:hypothetical protein